MKITFSNIEALVPFAKLRTQLGTFTGQQTPSNMALLDACTHTYSILPDLAARLIFTRDVGHHTSGWWKNPDYERCFHLSISFSSRGRAIPFEKKRAENIARTFFGDDSAWIWIDPPYSPEGKSSDVWHYRLFCDAMWKPINPRGEVYSKQNTPPDWKSFSEIHGKKPEPEVAA